MTRRVPSEHSVGVTGNTRQVPQTPMRYHLPDLPRLERFRKGTLEPLSLDTNHGVLRSVSPQCDR
jgi:hypothetical protein